MDNYLLSLDKYLDIGFDKLLQLLSSGERNIIEQNVDKFICDQEDVVLVVSKLFTKRSSVEYEKTVILNQL